MDLTPHDCRRDRIDCRTGILPAKIRKRSNPASLYHRNSGTPTPHLVAWIPTRISWTIEDYRISCIIRRLAFRDDAEFLRTDTRTPMALVYRL